MAMGLGEVRVPDDHDFAKFRNLATSTDGWVQKYSKPTLKVWVQSTTEQHVTSVKMMKLHKILNDVPATTMYDVLHDSEYRKVWDSNMIEGYELCMLNPNNDISYYAMKCPSPLKNRDFVMQRTWLETRDEFIIFNHSIYHKKLLPRKGYIRGDSYLTGYLVKPKSRGCELIYVTQSDPKGSLPKWVVNKVAKFVAPSLMHRLHKACTKYPAWKQKQHKPHYKPWLYPEQISLPRYNPDDIISKDDLPSDDSIEDESELKEDDFQEDIFLDE